MAPSGATATTSDQSVCCCCRRRPPAGAQDDGERIAPLLRTARAEKTEGPAGALRGDAESACPGPGPRKTPSSRFSLLERFRFTVTTPPTEDVLDAGTGAPGPKKAPSSRLSLLKRFAFAEDEEVVEEGARAGADSSSAENRATSEPPARKSIRWGEDVVGHGRESC